MSRSSTYKKIIEKIGTKERVKINKDEIDNETEFFCLLALEAMALGKDIHRATKILEAVSIEKTDDYGKSLYNEALLVINNRIEAKIDWLLEVANKTLELNPNAAFAKSIKGYVAVRLGNPTSGIDYYLNILKDYPNANWVYEQMVRVLFGFNAVKEAKQYIPMIKTRNKRYLYYLGSWFASVFNYFYLLLYFVIGLITDSLMAPFLFLSFPVLLIILAMVSKERPLVTKFLITSLQVFVVTILLTL